MSIAQSLLPEFDHEMATTRALLERVPEGQPEFKPHAKSMPLGYLAIHLATLPGWGSMTLNQTELDLNPPGGPGFVPPPFSTTAAAVEIFDQNVRETRATLEAASDADFLVPWTLKNGGTTIFTMPRVAVFRSFVMNHIIHHRGQLSVYLRMNNAVLPSIYGPTADAPM